MAKPMVVKLNLPDSSKSTDALLRKLDASFTKLSKTLTTTTKAAPAPVDLSRLVRSQDRLVAAMERVEKAVQARQQDAPHLERALERQWRKLQTAVKQVQHPTVAVALPKALYQRIDTLAQAPKVGAMPTGMARKFDALIEAVTKSRPTVRGMLR